VLAPARVCARTPRAPMRHSSRTAASTPKARRRAAAGERRDTCGESGSEPRSPLLQRACGRGARARAEPHQEQYQPRLNKMPHGLHSAGRATSAPAARVQMPLPRRLCARITRRRTRRAAVRQRPALAPQRGALRGQPGRVSACEAAQSHQASDAAQAAPRAARGLTFSCAVTHDGLAHFWARAAPPAGIAIELGVLSWAAVLGADAPTRARAAQTARPHNRRCCAPRKRARRRNQRGAAQMCPQQGHHRLHRQTQRDSSARAARVVRIGVDDGDQARVGGAVGEDRQRFAILWRRNASGISDGAQCAPQAPVARHV